MNTNEETTISDETFDEAKMVLEAVAIGDAVKERLKSDPDAVRKMLAGTVAVEDDVTVYPNKVLNLKFEKFQKRITDAGLSLGKQIGESDEDYETRTKNFEADYDKLESEFEALKAEIEDSAVTFHLVSLSKKSIKALRTAVRKKFPLPEVGGVDDLDVQEEREEYYKASIIAAHLLGEYTIEDIENIRDEWPTKCFAQLWTTAQKLSIADDYLGQAFNSDF